MELNNEFRVGVSVPEAWKVLTDVERIAPMLPGAQLQEVEGDEYRGVVKVKVGPITAQYKGAATFLEQDEDAGRVVLKASGRDTRGQGNASATITARMTPDEGGTKVTVTTDLTVTGKVAQFGRGVLAEVSSKLIGQFVDTLEADLASSGQAAAEPEEAATAGTAAPEQPAAGTAPGAAETGPEAAGSANGSAPGTSTGPRRIESADAEPLDLLAVAGGSTLKRLAPVAGVVLVLVIVLLRRRAKRASRLRRLADRVTP
ncbi:MAG TPA: SRPBCC family protein [Acidimicrobiales bacterium]|nr:SRPBCC family protein [Acidimicrobiales bacterium]